MVNWFHRASPPSNTPLPADTLGDVDLEHDAQPIPQRGIPKEIYESLRSWDWIARTLRITFIMLGSIATVSGLIATTFTQDLYPFWLKICTCSAAGAVGLLTAFDISGKANAMRRACRHLRAAIMQYQFDSAFTIADLINEYRKDQDLVGDVNYIPQKTGDLKRTRNGNSRRA